MSFPKKQKTSAGRNEVLSLNLAIADAHKILTKNQYNHLRDQLKQLVDFGFPDNKFLLDIQSFGQYHELREKGGPYGKINLRVYFKWEQRPKKRIIILHVYKKESEGKTHPSVMDRVDNRYEDYQSGSSDSLIYPYL